MILDAVKDLKVLVVGDAIIDEYCYVTPLGKSIKDNMISVQYHRKETFRGGVWAAAEHCRSFTPNVEVMIGPTITTNRRFVEEAYLRKLFVVHETQQVAYAPKKNFADYDLVIVTDFGHGCITNTIIAELTATAKFLAVNTQTNTSNYGFNLISRYPRADFVVLDELEARLAAHDRYSKLEDVILKLGFKRIIVTQGYLGAIGYDGQFARQAATASKVVDTMGAGDAFLCVSALFAATGSPMVDLVRIGNAAGAAKIATIGQVPVTPKSMEAYL